MKTKPPQPRLAPALLALALLSLTPAFGAEPAAAEKEKKLTKNQAKFDADQDGKLNDDEKAAAKAAAAAKAKETREANLAKYDADQDGKLSAEERARKKADEEAAKQARQAEREARKQARETAGN